MYHPIVKEQVIPGQLEGLQAISDYSYGSLECQAAFDRSQIKFRALVEMWGTFADANISCGDSKLIES